VAEASGVAGGPARTSVGVIFLVLFLDLVGFSILFPLYAGMLEHYGGAGHGLLAQMMGWIEGLYPDADPVQRHALFGGLLGAFYSLLQFVSAPWWGRMSDRHGRRPILLISLVGSCVAYVLWFFAGTFEVLLLSRLIAGLMGGSVSSANAAVADITASPRERGKAMGLVGMAFGLGFILGPVIGGLSYRLDHDYLKWFEITWLKELGFNPFSLPALVAASLSLINLVWAIARFRETLPSEKRNRVEAVGVRTANPVRLFTRSLGPGVVRINAAFVLHTLLFAGMETTLVFLTAQRLSFEPGDNAMLFGWMGFMAALTQGLVFRRLSPRFGPKPLAVAGFLLLIPGFAIIAAVDRHPSTALLVTGLTVLAAGTGLVFPGLTTLVSLATDARNQGLALGTFRSSGSLGRAIGPLLAAMTYFWFTPAAPYLCGTVGMLLPLWLIVKLRPTIAVTASPQPA
jgi:MFS family permease